MQITVSDVTRLIEGLRDDLFPATAGKYEREVMEILKANPDQVIGK